MCAEPLHPRFGSSSAQPPSLPMTGQEALGRGAVALRMAGIEDAEAEATLLLRHALGRDRVYLYMHLPERLSAEQDAAFRELLQRRLQHRPAAYLTGVREFYGIDFYVAPGVLIPRPETELLVDESLRLLRMALLTNGAPVFVDAGTGSGAIAIAVASHLAQVCCYAIDQSPAALAIAGLNAKRPKLAGRLELLQGDLLQPLPVAADLIAANLPYVPTAIWRSLPPEIRDHEPREALDGGTDGLDVIRRLVQQAPPRLRPEGALLLEVGESQAGTVAAMLGSAFPGRQIYALPDLAGIERVVCAAAKGELPRGAMLH